MLPLLQPAVYRRRPPTRSRGLQPLARRINAAAMAWCRCVSSGNLDIILVGFKEPTHLSTVFPECCLCHIAIETPREDGMKKTIFTLI